MAGMILLALGTWSASDGLFDWVLAALADRATDPLLAIRLRGTSTDGSRYLHVPELGGPQRRQVSQLIRGLPVLAESELPPSPQREDVVQHVRHLAALVGPTMGKTPLGTIPVASTALLADPVLHHPGGTLELSYRYMSDGRAVRGGIRFLVVRAFRKRAEGHCTVWHIDDAYDTLVEVTPSDWVAELREAQHEPRYPWEMHHYLIYIDSAGAYEVVGAGWEWLPEEPDGTE